MTTVLEMGGGISIELLRNVEINQHGHRIYCTDLISRSREYRTNYTPISGTAVLALFRVDLFGLWYSNRSTNRVNYKSTCSGSACFIISWFPDWNFAWGYYWHHGRLKYSYWTLWAQLKLIGLMANGKEQADQSCADDNAKSLCRNFRGRVVFPHRIGWDIRSYTNTGSWYTRVDVISGGI